MWIPPYIWTTHSHDGVRRIYKIVVNLVEIIRIRYRDHYWRMIIGIEFCVVLKVDNSLLILFLALGVLVLMMMLLLLVMMMMMMNLEFSRWSFVLPWLLDYSLHGQKSVSVELNSLVRVANAGVLYQGSKYHEETDEQIDIYWLHVGDFRKSGIDWIAEGGHGEHSGYAQTDPSGGWKEDCAGMKNL